METQEQLMPVETRRSMLFIGIPKETTLQENRVPLVPSGVATNRAMPRLAAKGLESGQQDSLHHSASP